MNTISGIRGNFKASVDNVWPAGHILHIPALDLPVFLIELTKVT